MRTDIIDRMIIRLVIEGFVIDRGGIAVIVVTGVILGRLFGAGCPGTS